MINTEQINKHKVTHRKQKLNEADENFRGKEKPVIVNIFRVLKGNIVSLKQNYMSLKKNIERI